MKSVADIANAVLPPAGPEGPTQEQWREVAIRHASTIIADALKQERAACSDVVARLSRAEIESNCGAMDFQQWRDLERILGFVSSVVSRERK